MNNPRPETIAAFCVGPHGARLDLEKQAEKPILITRYTKNSAEWLDAAYYNVGTGKPIKLGPKRRGKQKP